MGKQQQSASTLQAGEEQLLGDLLGLCAGKFPSLPSQQRCAALDGRGHPVEHEHGFDVMEQQPARRR
jgi:hypothetical protein